MTIEKEKINIVLATYNPNIEFFEKLVNSLKIQTFQSWICYILDDCSSIAIYNQIEAIISKLQDNRFILNKNNTNLGSFRTFLKGSTDSQNLFPSEYIAFCDQDDIWEKQKLELLYNYIKTKNFMLVHSDAMIIDEKDNFISNSLFLYEKRKYLTPTFNQLLIKNTITGCTTIYNSSLIDYIDWTYYKEKPQYHHDLLIALVASNLGKIGVIKDQLIKYRMHSDNVVGPQKNNNYFKNYFVIFLSFLFNKYRVYLINHFMLYESIYLDVSSFLNLNEGFNPVKLFLNSPLKFIGSYNIILPLVYTKLFLRRN